ncbi:endonuclease/exonuclease/phosphatase family protein [Chitinophaga deserti]|uniref:endonuclease/exonuclease/phosphatase family protein n=1 Tax=Chitinophaga deserti TaxID=2164099 RepID=UPI000D6CBC57|nr:endonuclease/exonuclease/phosphatase family protein [Chitinophaga deserti]
MKHILLLLLSTLFFYEGNAQKRNHTFTVMAWNILHGANDITDGKAKAIQIIREINPDVILMVETYGSGKLIADSLGYNFHLIAPEGTALDDKRINLSIISRYPFGNRMDTEHPFYLGGREVIIHSQPVRFFTNWFHYLPWENEPEKLGKTVEELLVWERSGSKFEMIQKVLPFIRKYAADAEAVPMIFGGDLNTPSHLDWGEATRKQHNDLVVPWYSTKVLEDMGLLDTYRKLHPDPVTHPGITWHTKGVKDNHRIDYIFYKGSRLKAIKSEVYKAFLNEPIHLNGKEIIYPSDHGFVVTTFEMK